MQSIRADVVRDVADRIINEAYLDQDRDDIYAVCFGDSNGEFWITLKPSSPTHKHQTLVGADNAIAGTHCYYRVER